MLRDLSGDHGGQVSGGIGRNGGRFVKRPYEGNEKREAFPLGELLFFAFKTGVEEQRPERLQ